MKRRALLTSMLLVAAFGSAPARGAEPIELRFAVSSSAQVFYNSQALIPWAKKVTEDSQGTLNVKLYFAGALGRAGQFVDIVESGAADIAMDITSYYPGRFPQADVTYLPSLIGNDAAKASDALWSMYEEGLFNRDFAGLKLLGIGTPTAAMLLTTEKPVKLPSDTVGLKIGAGGRMKAAILDATGAAMINLEAFNMYQPMERGVVDGVITHMTGVPPFRLYEIGKFYTMVPLGGSFTPVFMSQARFDSLPEPARHAIEINSGAVLTKKLGAVWQKASDDGVAVVKRSGGTIIIPDEAEHEEWERKMQPVVQAWIKAGDDRQRIFDTLKAKLAQ
ncbi:TRAP transporter substrate-binding protein [Agrobacterium sp. lyk4-40-TYG-31]|uniref:TRAP transporter substrate-binding protein n=1 Tax=Agrobacterium sp. lyk4-40-TYG-31 TaxID=3040276 RepID=UPI00254EBD25|nr:TRAP transporter substrate-binding protein [Agrobacterium sp. lyk4-40-TYG-31]